MPEAPTVSIVVPARNEARNLEFVLPALPTVHEIIVVDGASVDDTLGTARRIRPEVRTIQQSRRGKGNALACGFEAATGEIIVMFDADGSADPAEIPRFVAALVDGADFAKGSRFHTTPTARGASEDITPIRQVGNAGLNLLANLAFDTRYTDLCYGYNAFWRRILPVLRLPPTSLSGPAPTAMLWGDGFEIETVISCRAAAGGLRVAEVPSLERARAFGQSNLRTFVDGTRVLRTIITEGLRHRVALNDSLEQEADQPKRHPPGVMSRPTVRSAALRLADALGERQPHHRSGLDGETRDQPECGLPMPCPQGKKLWR